MYYTKNIVSSLKQLLMRYKIVCVLLLCIAIQTNAQEVLRNVEVNTLLQFSSPPQITSRGAALTLPFVDDFSYCQKSFYPNPQLWQSNQTYINCTYPVRPPTIGVATFDGLNQYGIPYDTLLSTFNPRPADTLRSLSIDLSGYTAADSLYLSFYFQAQGLGDAPNNNDSLILEFLRFNGSWSKRWGVNGQSFNEFKIVMIPIKASEFFHDLFQFRFRNYASVTGNNDHWHLDYVKLDANRNSVDTLMNDIAIQRYSTGILKNYAAMPWNQFKANASNEVSAVNKMYFRNNFGIAKNTSYSYKIEEVTSATTLATQALQSFNFDALQRDSATVQTINPASIISQNNALIKATYYCYATGTGDIVSANDTLTVYHRFGNYFAYDDGSAEKVYGILGTGAKGALRYKCNTPDTVQAVQIHFARLQGVQSSLLFSILVYKELNPETLLYQQDFNKPDYIDTVNGFATYILDSGIYVNDVFYIGWLQSQQDMIYMGFDRNTNAKQHLFYNIGSTWQNSLFDGSLMFRPIMGKRADLNIGIREIKKYDAISFFPNPASDYIMLDVSDDAAYINATYEVKSLSGSVIQYGILQHKKIDIRNLMSGMYLIQITRADGYRQILKMIKS